MSAWKGETRIWLLPDLKKPVRWEEQIGGSVARMLAIPSETLECVDVFHIGENGYVWGLEASSRFPGSTVEGMLKAWLNQLSPQESFTFCCAPESIRLQMPKFRRSTLAYKTVKLKLVPGPTVPISSVSVRRKAMRIQWPPKGRAIQSVSPDGETVDRYGPMYREDKHGIPIAISNRDSSVRGVHVLLVAPNPFGRLLGLGIGMDVLYERDHMIQIASRSAANPQGALREAKDAADGFLFEGWTTQQLAWFLPLFAEKGARVALDHASFQLNLPIFATPEAAMRSERWLSEMAKQVSIRRVWGLWGLMWMLLLDSLEEGNKWRSCERCGRTFAGKRGKRFCGSQENKDCFRRRRAQDRQRERAKSASSLP